MNPRFSNFLPDTVNTPHKGILAHTALNRSHEAGKKAVLCDDGCSDFEP